MCKNVWEPLIYTQTNLGEGKIYSRGDNSGFLQVLVKSLFQGGNRRLKFSFTNSKLRRNIFKFQNPGVQSKSRMHPLRTTHLSISFRFAIIVQHYNRMLHKLCGFCVMPYCHNFSFVDVLLLRCYILSLLADYIKQCC